MERTKTKYVKMKEYGNYIFDLYGTLLDISTNERKMSLWNLMADFYNVYGCKWTGRELSKAFWRMDAEERELLMNRTGVEYPEIKLERVFARLLFEVENKSLKKCANDIAIRNTSWYSCGMKIAGESIAELRIRYFEARESVLYIVLSSDWITAVSNLFRVYSRKYIRPYTNTISTLLELKSQGKRIYLLSNAQRIFTMPEIEMFGLNTLFDRMYISSDYGMMKPEKQFMERLIADEGLDIQESVMVGNEFQSDMAIAMRCGMDGIYLNTSSYTKKQIDEESNALMERENVSAKLLPEIVMSGDIGEIIV